MTHVTPLRAKPVSSGLDSYTKDLAKRLNAHAPARHQQVEQALSDGCADKLALAIRGALHAPNGVPRLPCPELDKIDAAKDDFLKRVLHAKKLGLPITPNAYRALLAGALSLEPQYSGLANAVEKGAVSSELIRALSGLVAKGVDFIDELMSITYTSKLLADGFRPLFVWLDDQEFGALAHPRHAFVVDELCSATIWNADPENGRAEFDPSRVDVAGTGVKGGPEFTRALNENAEHIAFLLKNGDLPPTIITPQNRRMAALRNQMPSYDELVIAARLRRRPSLIHREGNCRVVLPYKANPAGTALSTEIFEMMDDQGFLRDPTGAALFKTVYGACSGLNLKLVNTLSGLHQLMPGEARRAHTVALESAVVDLQLKTTLKAFFESMALGQGQYAFYKNAK